MENIHDIVQKNTRFIWRNAAGRAGFVGTGVVLDVYELGSIPYVKIKFDEWPEHGDGSADEREMAVIGPAILYVISKGEFMVDERVDSAGEKEQWLYALKSILFNAGLRPDVTPELLELLMALSHPENVAGLITLLDLITPSAIGRPATEEERLWLATLLRKLADKLFATPEVIA